MNVPEIMGVYTSAPTQTAVMCASATQDIVSVVTKRTVQVQLHDNASLPVINFIVGSLSGSLRIAFGFLNC